MKKIGGVLILASLILVLGVATSALAQTEGEITLEENGDITVTQTNDAVEVTQASRTTFGGGDNWRNIEVFVSVTDANGNAVTGLSPSDFTLREDGTVQQLDQQCFEQGAGTSGRVSTELVIDRSGSMDSFSSPSPMDQAKNAAQTYVGLMGSNDEAEVRSFSSDITVDQAWTTDKQALNSSIDQITAGGSTNLWDASIQGINSASNRVGVGGNARSAVIVMTDGKDNAGSTSSVDPVIQTAQDKGVQVYTIGFGNPDPDIGRLANETGGQFFDLPDASELDRVYQDISQGIGQEYKLCYETSNAATDGSERIIEVSSPVASADGVGSYTAPNSTPPVVDFQGKYDDSDSSGLTVEFNGSDTIDLDGDISEIRWDFLNDGTVDQTGENVTFTFPDSGEYETRADAVDNDGDTSSVVDEVAVGDEASLTVTSNSPVPSGSQLEVDVDASNVGSVTISNIPNGTNSAGSSWSVVSSTNDGAFLTPDDSNGDNIAGSGSVTWVWAADQATADTTVTLNVPSGFPEGTYDLQVESENNKSVTRNQVLGAVVGSGGPSVDDYRVNPNDPTSAVDLSGLQDAIDDFVSNNTDLSLLQDVINEFIAT